MSSTTYNIPLEKTMQAEVDALNRIANKLGAFDEPYSYAAIQAETRLGRISRFFQAGDQASINENGLITANVDGESLTNISVDKDTFLEIMGTDTTTYVFTYNGSYWTYDDEEVTLADYGITVTGTPAEGDSASVRYTATAAVYDVSGVDEEEPANPNFSHVLSLIRKDCLGLLPFDPPQFLFYVDPTDYPSGLPAGTYNIVLDHATYDGSTTEDCTIEFTTTQVVPAGGGLRATKVGEWRSAYSKATMLTGKIITYQADGLTTVETNIAVAEGSSGTNLGTTTASNPTYLSGSNINFSQRNMYGSNRWSTCYLRQVLNSRDAVVQFVKGTKFSRPHSAQDVEGFLHALDPELVAVLGKVKKRYALSIADGYGYEDIEDYVTLATMLDIFGSQNNSIYEGPVNSSGTVTRTVAKSLWRLFLTTNADRIKYLAGTARDWWLSSAHPSIANNERYVVASGALSNYCAFSSYGVVPELHII